MTEAGRLHVNVNYTLLKVLKRLKNITQEELRGITTNFKTNRLLVYLFHSFARLFTLSFTIMSVSRNSQNLQRRVTGWLVKDKRETVLKEMWISRGWYWGFYEHTLRKNTEPLTGQTYSGQDSKQARPNASQNRYGFSHTAHRQTKRSVSATLPCFRRSPQLKSQCSTSVIVLSCSHIAQLQTECSV